MPEEKTVESLQEELDAMKLKKKKNIIQFIAMTSLGVLAVLTIYLSNKNLNEEPDSDETAETSPPEMVNNDEEASTDVPEFDGSKGFDFETGDLQGAKVTDGKFGQIVTNRKALWTKIAGSNVVNYNKEGKYFLSTYEVSNKDIRGTNEQTGTVTSDLFKLKRAHLSLLIAGGDNEKLTYFAMYLENGKEIYKVSNKKRSERFKRVTADLSDYLNQNVYWKAVDKSTRDWGYIAIDNIKFSNK